MRQTVLAVGIVLGGCAVSPEQFSGPTGKAAYTMACSGMMRTVADCYREASRLCPAGYTVVAESHTGHVDGVSRRLTVECK